MSFVFRPAVREQTSLLIGLAGPSGSGKTLSALLLARGMMAGDDRRIFMIDTEGGRGTHFACAPGEKPGPYRFAFQYGELRAPFSPEAYTEAVLAAVAAGAGVVIVDSASHEQESEGGMLEWHERELDRMAGKDYAKRERMTFAAWIAPKREHNRYVNTILQQRAHFIFCFRAKDKMKLVKNAQTGRTEPVQLGWTAICPDRFEYEMTTLLMLPPNARGVPDLSLESTKLNIHHREFFPEGKAITEEAGRKLAAWAYGGAQPSKSASPPSTAPLDATGSGDPRAELLDAIAGATAKWQRQPTDAEWRAVCQEVCGNADLQVVDVAALTDLLTLLQAVSTGDAKARERLTATFKRAAKAS